MQFNFSCISRLFWKIYLGNIESFFNFAIKLQLIPSMEKEVKFYYKEIDGENNLTFRKPEINHFVLKFDNFYC